MSILTLDRRRLDLRHEPVQLLHPALSETARQVLIRDHGMYPISVMWGLTQSGEATQIVGPHGIENGLSHGAFKFFTTGAVEFFDPVALRREVHLAPAVFAGLSIDQVAMFDAESFFNRDWVAEKLAQGIPVNQVERENRRLWWFYPDGRVTLEPPPLDSPAWHIDGNLHRTHNIVMTVPYTIYDVVERGWLRRDHPGNPGLPAAVHHAVLTREDEEQIARAVRDFNSGSSTFTIVSVDETTPTPTELRLGFRVASAIIRACREGSTRDINAAEYAGRLVGCHRSGLSDAHKALLNMLIEQDVLLECDRCGAVEYTDDAVDVQDEGRWCESCADTFSFVCSDCGERYPTSLRRHDAHGEEICTNCVDDHYLRCGSCDELFHADSEAWQNGSDGRCESCSEDEEESELIQSYSTDVIRKLRWRGANGVRYFGAEIEMESMEVRTNVLARTLMEHADGWGILKHDGSLTNGVELVTLPLTLKAWQDSKLCILHACSEAARLGARSHNTRTCGLHIHVTRDTVSEPTIAKLTMFLNDPVNETFLSKIARRSTSASYCQASKKMWKAPTPEYVELDLKNDERMRLAIEHWPGDGYFNDTDASSLTKHFTYQGRDAVLRLSARTYEGLMSMKTLEKFKTRAYGDGFRITVSQVQRRGRVENQSGRYTPLNLGNEKTIEFRLFKGTLNPETIQASVEFCDALIEWAKDASASALTAEAFMAWGQTHITRKTYPSLSAYMVRRRLRPARDIPKEYRHAMRALAEPEAA